MARVYNKNLANQPARNEVTTSEACEILGRSARWLSDQINKKSTIIPLYTYGNQHVFSRQDVIRLRNDHRKPYAQ